MKKLTAILMVLFIITCTINSAFAKKAPKTETSSSEITQTEKTTGKTKKEKASKNKTNDDKTSQTKSSQEKARIEGVRHRSALSMYLNPNLDIQEIRASHILVKKRKDAVKIRKDIINGNITFEDAAKEYSLCPTGVKGGDLGYFNRKRMDQVFSDTAFDLKIGEISNPVGTKFGWHLIKVYDKR